MSLDTIERETAENPDYSVIWLHGLGADYNDFLPVVPELVRPYWPGIRFIFPNAPVRPVTINNNVPMRAWYDIREANFENRADMDGVRASVAQVEELIAKENARGIDSTHIFLAGFSQGGAVTLAAGLQRQQPLAGLIALSTYLPAMDKAKASMRNGAEKQPVFMAHGTQDPVVPYQMGARSAEVLSTLGFDVTWRGYSMPHSVNLDEITDLSQWMEKHLHI